MQWYTGISDLVSGGSCLLLMAAFTICAAFRWWHMCPPFNGNPDYYYPARRSVCAFFLWHLLYIPFLLYPSARSAVEYASCVELIILSAMLPVIMIKFFRPRGSARLRSSALNYEIPLSLLACVGVWVVIFPEKEILGSYTLFKILCGVPAVLMSLSFARELKWLAVRIDRYHLDEYSNEEDFPYVFAKKVIWAPCLVLLFCWVIFFTSNRGMMTALWLLMAVMGVRYTIAILSPQRGVVESVSDRKQSARESAPPEPPTETDPRLEALRKRVIEVCRRHYLEPHLTRREIISEFDYGERTLAGQIISEYGFYTLINTLRLEHARRYAESHPSETKESIAVNSGFKDRFAMRHARRKIGDGGAIGNS